MRTEIWGAVVLGAACAFVLLLSPAVLPSSDAVVPAVLPLGFYSAGATAQVLRPGHRVGDRLLAVGILHLSALVGAVVVGRWPGTAVPVAWLSAVLYALGFVALLDLLARYPTGRYAWPALARVVPVTAAAVGVVATLAVLGSIRTPSVLEFATGPNPVHVPALSALAPAIAVVALLPVAGLVLLLARYRHAPPADRSQMRWPLITTAVIAVALVSTAWAEDVLGPEAQAALFVTAGIALPVSFLVGLLRHTEQADRLADVAASRARLAEVAEAERRRIERDLHDGAQQSILALMARVEIARARLPVTEDGVDAELRDIGIALRDVHRELHELARGVHPAVLTDHGLPEAVRSALTRLPPGTELVVAPELAGVRFPAGIEGAAYFLVLEGLANTVKHSGNPAAVVTLAGSEDLLEVTVRDSGRGFDPAGAHGFGLVGMADRLAAVGGQLVVESRPGAGTTLRGLLPVSSHAG